MNAPESPDMAEEVLAAYGPGSGLIVNPLGGWFHGRGEPDPPEPTEPAEAKAA